jgi:CRP-like cAMP-binding protein
VLAGLVANSKKLAVLGPGQFFGEEALLSSAPRNAHVRSCEPMELFVLHKGSLEVVFDEFPGLEAAIRHPLDKRTRAQLMEIEAAADAAVEAARLKGVAAADAVAQAEKDAEERKARAAAVALGRAEEAAQRAEIAAVAAKAEAEAQSAARAQAEAKVAEEQAEAEAQFFAAEREAAAKAQSNERHAAEERAAEEEEEGEEEEEKMEEEIEGEEEEEMEEEMEDDRAAEEDAPAAAEEAVFVPTATLREVTGAWTVTITRQRTIVGRGTMRAPGGSVLIDDDTILAEHAGIVYDSDTDSFNLTALGKKHLSVGHASLNRELYTQLWTHADGNFELRPGDLIAVGRTQLIFDRPDPTTHATTTSCPGVSLLVHYIRPDVGEERKTTASLRAQDGACYQISHQRTILGRTPDTGPVDADCLLGYNRSLSRQHAEIACNGAAGNVPTFLIRALGKKVVKVDRQQRIISIRNGEATALQAGDRIRLGDVRLTFAHSAAEAEAEARHRAEAEARHHAAEAEARHLVAVAHDAAGKIQRAYRGRLAYYQLMGIAYELSLSRVDPDAEWAASIIQAAWRGFAARTDGKLVYEREQRQAAAACLQMGWKARKVRQSLNACAAAVQAAWRGYACREGLLMQEAEREWASKEIQRMWRGFSLRLMMHVADKEDQAVVLIQAVVRGVLLRNQICEAGSAAAAAVIQRMWRGVVSRARTLDLVAAITVQRNARGWLCRKSLHELARWEAAALIQERWLEHVLRKQYTDALVDHETQAAILIQASARGYVTRELQWREIEMVAAVYIQAWTRGWLLRSARRRALILRGRRRWAAHLIQACARGWSSEKDVKLAQKLGQLQPFIAVFPRQCMGQLVYS